MKKLLHIAFLALLATGCKKEYSNPNAPTEDEVFNSADGMTRAIVGTGIGTKGAIVPLVFGTVPFLARQMDTALSEVSDGVIEAAQAMGSSPWEIIFRVYLREGLPGIIRGITITAVSLIGLSAMAGSIGGGGLGDFAIRYGYQRNHNDVTYVTVAVILVMVTILQSIGSYFVKRTTH